MGSSGGWLSRLVLGVIFLLAVQGVSCEHEPTESECRPYIEKALKEHHVDEDTTEENVIADTSTDEEENSQANPIEDGGSEEGEGDVTDGGIGASQESAEGNTQEETDETGENADGSEDENKTDEQNETATGETVSEAESLETDTNEVENAAGGVDPNETVEDVDSNETAEVEGGNAESETVEVVEDGSQETASQEGESSAEGETGGETSQEGDTKEEQTQSEGNISTQEEGRTEDTGEGSQESAEQEGDLSNTRGDSQEDGGSAASAENETLEVQEQESVETQTAETAESLEKEGETDEKSTTEQSSETIEEVGEEGSGDGEAEQDRTRETESVESKEYGADTNEVTTEEPTPTAESVDTKEDITEESTDTKEDTTGESTDTKEDTTGESADTKEDTTGESDDTKEDTTENEIVEPTESEGESQGSSEGQTEEQSEEAPEEEELIKEREIPTNLRPKEHITQILKLDEESVAAESAVAKNTDALLKNLKNLYDNAIKPLEILYKYRDLSNRHFGDPEIFSKPLVLFMGPWSGGKSSTINYLLDLEFTDMALRTGAEPSPAYFNILMYGDQPEILDGTQLAADWTFSGLQKFGQGLLDRLRGVRLPNRLLEKVNIVEIPGILEIRKQVQRLFPFNDACQWFIDRADIIFLVYDPAKLDVGPETEAILDQLKGREYQTRIILNKADQVKPEELMRVQGTLIWNISPLMSSQEPPVMYTTSLWSLPYESGAPTRLLLAQERAMLRDLRDAIERRVENKIASARRFAVRVRNHAKMVDCYLTTYYNHKTFFGNKKKISDDIIENPTKYHIYEGLSTLTNISRYDLPDPDMYKDFFRINPLYDFTKLSDTCTYFRGCPINKLDIAIAYDLPELVGKYKKAIEAAKSNS